jgi:hypothetical protein
MNGTYLTPAPESLPLNYDFKSDFDPGGFSGDWTPYYTRRDIWLNYSRSIGATTNIDFMGTRNGNPDGFCYSGMYTTTQPRVETFELPLPREHTVVKVVYRVIGSQCCAFTLTVS